MPATINVNDKTVVHQTSSGIATAFPDVCKTPTPGGPVPIPYPNIAKSADTAQGSQTVTMDGNPIMLKGSIYATSIGDEPGTAGGVVSGVNKGKAEFLNYSFDVKVEGKNVCRLGDPMGQNESSLNIGGFPNMQPPTVAKGKLKRQVLTGKVTEILFESGIDLHEDEKGAPVPPAGQPHYKRGKSYKTYPAVYLRKKAGGQKKLKVTLEITDLENVSGSAELWGTGGGIRVKKTSFSLTKGVIGPLDTEFEEIPDEAVYFRQGIKWKVKAGGRTYPVGSTNVKLFFLYDKPAKPWTGSPPVWQTILEFLFNRVGVKGKKEKDAVTKITRYCHTSHDRVYDTMSGAPGFSTPGYASGSMNMSGYLKGGPAVVCCYDQAIAVITLAAAVGIEVDWVFMQPYGYITTTNLVGVGSCNNPFFSNPRYLSDKIVPPGTRPTHVSPGPGGVRTLVRGRSAFGNHAFCRYSGKIYDACAKPHLGTETPNAYTADSIDISRDYYFEAWSRMVSGTVSPHAIPSEDDMHFVSGYVSTVT
jgi:hypothetical protein